VTIDEARNNQLATQVLYHGVAGQFRQQLFDLADLGNDAVLYNEQAVFDVLAR
jgi:hypothetical protein